MESRKTHGICAIFFDLDNTLIRTRKADDLTCDKLKDFLNRQYSIPQDTAKKICKRYLKMFRKCPDNCLMTLHDWRQQLWRKALGECFEHLTVIVYHKWLELRYKYLALSADVHNMLLALSTKYLLVLITNGTCNAQWEKIDKLNLRPLFDLILVSGDYPWEKPEPEIFLEACNQLGIEPSQVVMVGDKLSTDICGGINSKLAANIWIPLGEEKLQENDPVPDFILSNVVELNGLIPKIANIIKSRVPLLQLSDVEDSYSNSSDGS